MMKALKKYSGVFGASMKENSKSYVNALNSAVSILVILFIFLQLWSYIYSNGQPVINGFSLNQMMQYLVMAELIAYSLRKKQVMDSISSDIKTGRIAYLLNKPFNYFIYTVFYSTGEMVFKLCMLVPVAFLTSFLFTGSLVTLQGILPIILVLVLNAVLTSTVYACISMLTFWLEDADPFGWVFEKMLMLFGVFFPPQFFPQVLQPFIYYSPIYAMYSGPSMLFASFSWQTWGNVVMWQTFYIGVFVALGLIMYHFGTKKVNIYGG